MSITATHTWADGELLTAADLNARFVNCETYIPVVASQSDMDAMTDTTKYITASLKRISLGTPVASTSGTTKLFSSVPSGVRRITMNLVGVSTSGTSNWIIQLGDAGGIENSGYLGAATTIASATPSTARFTTGYGLTNAIAAASVAHGTITLTLENSSSFTWVLTSTLSLSNADTTHLSSGSKSLSQELNQIQITTSGGADTFDAGEINITFER